MYRLQFLKYYENGNLITYTEEIDDFLSLVVVPFLDFSTAAVCDTPNELEEHSRQFMDDSMKEFVKITSSYLVDCAFDYDLAFIDKLVHVVFMFAFRGRLVWARGYFYDICNISYPCLK